MSEPSKTVVLIFVSEPSKSVIEIRRFQQLVRLKIPIANKVIKLDVKGRMDTLKLHSFA